MAVRSTVTVPATEIICRMEEEAVEQTASVLYRWLEENSPKER